MTILFKNANIITMSEITHSADAISTDVQCGAFNFFGWLLCEDDKIADFGKGETSHTADEVIDCEGGSIYPGFIDAHTHLGLFNSGCGVEGEDFNEDSDPCTPQLSVCDGINPLDRSFREALMSGVTTAVVAPGSTNPIAGRIYAVRTDGRRIDNMLIRECGMKFALGENPKMTYMNKDEAPCTRMATAAIIREALSKAKRYMEDKQSATDDSELDEPEYDQKWEALIPLLKGEASAHFHCHRADDIFTAIRISKEFSLKYTLIHCTEGHLIAEELAEEYKAKPFFTVVGPIISDRSKPELANLTTANAAVLAKQKIPTAICTDHGEVPIQYLTLSAAIAVKGGMPPTQAMSAITINAARAAGIDDILGSIEKGKLADLVIYKKNEHPLSIMSEPLAVVCGGKITYPDGSVFR